MDYPAAKAFLYGLRNRGVKYGIDRMKLFVELLGHPQLKFPVIHVAGTNGKGSVCAMLESIFRASGYKTGLFTSPHLVRQGERIQINRCILHEDEIAGYTTELKESAEYLARIAPEDHPSFFEFMTAMAFLHFLRQKVDVAIVEVGLGGRLDATNVVNPECSVITSISLDHCDILGHTHEIIAREKAGIIKSGKPLVIGALPDDAETVVRTIAQERNAPLTAMRELFGEDPAAYPQSALEGAYQRVNAATALSVCHVLKERFKLTDRAISTGLETVRWAGRWQRVRAGDKDIILDATHNPEGARVLGENLARLIEITGKKPIILCGSLGEARARALMDVVSRYARELHLFRPAQPRAIPFELLEACIPSTYTGPVTRQEVAVSFPFARHCTIGEPGDVLVVTGSIYLLGEIIERLQCDEPVNQSILQD